MLEAVQFKYYLCLLSNFMEIRDYESKCKLFDKMQYNLDNAKYKQNIQNAKYIIW